MILQLVYISASPERDAPRDIDEILSASRRNNPAEGLTGILVFSDGSYFQVLEGEAEAVERRFAIIRADKRHSFVTRLIRREIPARMFPDWAMAWRDCPPDHPVASGLRALVACAGQTDQSIDPVLAALMKPSLGAASP